MVGEMQYALEISFYLTLDIWYNRSIIKFKSKDNVIGKIWLPLPTTSNQMTRKGKLTNSRKDKNLK